ncbi:hypothetical protein [Pelagibius sp.]|uniref:hypothetical protein n=1 Tax=Pelagibius sp. TaxID=1931238 RepID=UPI003B501B77
MAILLLASGAPVAIAAEPDARLKQAAQHFADLEDDAAKAILDELSAEGLADADVLLGYLYADPLYEARDDETAMSHFERAAQRDHPEAIFQLAESAYWAGYLHPQRGAPTQILGLGNGETYALLKRAIALKHGGAVFRLALLCIFEDYDCTDDEVEMSLNVRWTAVRGGVRYLTDPFSALRLLEKEEESFERSQSFHNYLEVGLSFVNPLVATVWGGGWQHVTERNRCPSVHHPSAVNRMFAKMNGVKRSFSGSLSLEDCYSTEELEALDDKVFNMLDGIVTLHGTFQVSHIRWCFENLKGRASAACLANAAFDHQFACSKLSMAPYLYGMDVPYVGSPRYLRCREHMLGARGR